MAVEVAVRFTPDSLADYDDMFGVDTPLGRFEVPLRGARPIPCLTLPPVLSAGDVVVGNSRTTHVKFQNLGGPGRFRTVPSSFWPGGLASAPTDRASLGPFTLWPLYLDLPHGAEGCLTLEFSPQQPVVAEERVVLVCDNCQVKEFTLRGTGSDIDIILIAIDDRGITADDLSAPLWFGQVSCSCHVDAVVRYAGCWDAVCSQTLTAGWSPWAHVRHKYIQTLTISYGSALYCTKTHSKGLSSLNLSHVVPIQAVPGSCVSRRLLVCNNTALNFPFQWRQTTNRIANGSSVNDSPELALFGSSQQQADFQQAQQMYLHEQQQTNHAEDDEPSDQASSQQQAAEYRDHHGNSTSSTAGPAGFTIYPSSGVIKARETLQFLVTFHPDELQPFIQWSQLLVDRAGATADTYKPNQTGSLHASKTQSQMAAIKGHDVAAASYQPVLQPPAELVRPQANEVMVLELGLEGVTAPCLLDVQPPAINIPGVLTKGDTTEHVLVLSNPSPAPANFRFDELDTADVLPSSGQVPPYSSIEVTVKVNAATPGPLSAVLLCHVGNGITAQIPIRSQVQEPAVEIASSVVDFGLIKIGSSAVKELVIHNPVRTSEAAWVLQQLPQVKVMAQLHTMYAAAGSHCRHHNTGSSHQTPLLCRMASFAVLLLFISSHD